MGDSGERRRGARGCPCLRARPHMRRAWLQHRRRAGAAAAPVASSAACTPWRPWPRCSPAQLAPSTARRPRPQTTTSPPAAGAAGRQARPPRRPPRPSAPRSLWRTSTWTWTTWPGSWRTRKGRRLASATTRATARAATRPRCGARGGEGGAGGGQRRRAGGWEQGAGCCWAPRGLPLAPGAGPGGRSGAARPAEPWSAPAAAAG
jgi:hypothetical protein